MKYTLKVEYDEKSDEYIAVFPEELTSLLNWNVGDVVKWIDNKDGSWTLHKKEEKNA